ncbi:nurim homolog [Liolophura sinensis]|uniref:nurim homolog n=1 Tax=Liolophura sinensis TaxID=3198878 RepID=UPI003159525E
MDVKPNNAPVFNRVITDVLLVLMFIVQHRLMATRAYKELFMSFGDVALALERLVYNLTSAVSLQVMISWWQPIPDYSLWELETNQGGLLWLFFFCLHAILWLCLIFLAMSFDPLEFLGLKQVWYQLNGWRHPLFYTNKYLRRLYSKLRHPGMICFLSLLWLHPVMSLDRCLLAAALVVFVISGPGVMDGEYMYINQTVKNLNVPNSH